ncbi:SNF2-related protein [Dactylosporangium sp. CA-139114]|uniref:SNF2-related protein n=1 Tax=Dactylosporangium sp. CA-139114 TaxID=3239931 RepID=UPI003D98E3A6
MAPPTGNAAATGALAAGASTAGAPATDAPSVDAPTAGPRPAAFRAAGAPLAATETPTPRPPAPPSLAAVPVTGGGRHGHRSTDLAEATASAPDASVTGPAPDSPPPPAANGCTADPGGPAVHPFAVLPPLPGTVATADLLLPSTPHHPAPSPELVAHLPARRRPAARRHTVWTVPIVVLPPGSDPDLLLSAVSGVAPGASIGALTDLVVFATDLTGRGRFLPALTTEPAPGGGRGPAARWRPALWGADAATFDALCRAMPGVAASALDPARHRFRLAVDRPAWSPGDAARAALDAAVDHLVRSRLRGEPLLGDEEPRHDTAVRAWLAALTTSDARLRTTTVAAASAERAAVAGNGGGGFAAQARAQARAVAAAAARGLPVPEPAAAEPEPEPGPGPGVGVGAVMADGPEVARLRELLERWSDSGRPAPVRTCFRLSYVEAGDDDDDLAPDPAGAERPAGTPGRFDEDGGSWLVEFLLQPAAEPGLLVPARDVWHDGASPLFRWVDYPQDVLLEDLGRASRLWPDLDEALWGPRPESLRLDTIGAHRFLTFASLLHDAGFGVLLPAQWQRRQELGLTLSVRTRQPAAPVLRDTTTNRAAIVGFRWGLAIGDEFLSEADLAELARAKVPLVRLRGRWVHLDRERLRAGLAFLRRGGRGEMTAGEAMRLTRLVPDADLPLPVTGVDGEGWLADLLTGRAPERLELLDPPPGLTAQLRPYQRRGLSWLAFLDAVGVGALLADDMGLGKTVQVLALEAHLRAQGPRPPTLIVCPLSVLGNWRREIERFTPHLTVRVHHGAARRAGSGPDGADLVLTTYQVATRDADTLAAVAWDRVVLDEAQHVKNAAGVTARAVRRFPARHRVALTGTPVENRLTELWSIADFLNPGLLGEASLFRARYSVPVERWGDEDAARRLRRVTRPFLLRRVKTDRAVIADLPEKFERRQWCNLTLEQATLYKAVIDELFVKLREGRAGSRRKGLVLSAMTKLKQVCNHPAHLLGDGTPLPGRSGKLARLEEILAAATEAGDRALVFTQFAKFGQLLAPHLAQRLGTGVEFLHGGTPQGSRDRMVERFQSGPGPGVLLVSLKAGGTGLNLTAANHVVHVDRWWNPAAEAQATDRAFRIGQRRDVQVHTFVCIGTIEERVEEIMAGKRDLAGVAVGSGEGWLTGLSTNDLLDLMSLAPEAVADV